MCINFRKMVYLLLTPGLQPPACHRGPWLPPLTATGSPLTAPHINHSSQRGPVAGLKTVLLQVDMRIVPSFQPNRRLNVCELPLCTQAAARARTPTRGIAALGLISASSLCRARNGIRVLISSELGSPARNSLGPCPGIPGCQWLRSSRNKR